MQEKITDFLSKTQEATAKKIAAGIGESDAQSSVNSALNAMRTDGIVECEKRKGKGNELVYWLAKPVEPMAKQPAKVFTQPAHDNEVADLRAKLGLLGTMLINIEGDSIEDKLGKVLHDHLHATQRISDLEDDVRRHSERSSDGERANGAWLSLAAEYECKSVPDLRVFIESLERRVDVLKMAVESMHEQLDAKQGNTSFDVSSAVQYIVKTPSRPPRFTKLHKNAHSVAMSSARQHGFAEVFALVPVGKAVRGAEWRPK